jgi:hypothetical protein
MNLKRRDLLLAAGLTLVFGTSASARILVEGNMDALRAPSTPRRLSLVPSGIMSAPSPTQ